MRSLTKLEPVRIWPLASLSPYGAPFKMGDQFAGNLLSEFARVRTNVHVGAVPNAGSRRMPAEGLAPTSTCRAGYTHVRITLALTPNSARPVGTTYSCTRASP